MFTDWLLPSVRGLIAKRVQSYPDEDESNRGQQRREYKLRRKSDRNDQKLLRLEVKAAKLDYMATKCQYKATRCHTRKQKKWEKRAERCAQRASVLASQLDGHKFEQTLNCPTEEPYRCLDKVEEAEGTLQPPSYEDVVKQPPSYDQVAQAPPLYPVLM